ncbi:elongation factor Ts [Chloroflexota bacterium]
MEKPNIPASMVKDLREQTGAGIMICRKALINTDGDMEKALEILKQQNLYRAEKKIKRVANQGIVEAYIHGEGRIGAMIELNCETDFVARTDDFKALAHHLAMQVAALSPQFTSKEEIPEGTDIDPAEACLLLQADIKDPSRTIQDIILENIARVGENIKIKRFARFELGVVENKTTENASE